MLRTTLASEVNNGDLVLLYQDTRRKWLAKVGSLRFHTHKGFVELAQLVGKQYGSSVLTSRGLTLWIFRPTLLELIENFERPTQILYPKDIGYSIYRLGLEAGSRVIEVGTGSGAMAAAIAMAVAPGGHVYSYEMRPEFLKIAQKNLEMAAVSSTVTLHNRDPSDGFEETNVDAVILDLGDPWRLTNAAWRALTEGGTLAGFTPTFNQLERLVDSLKKNSFLVWESVEVILRELKTEAGKVRPESRMVGHTAYVTIARKILQNG